MPSHVFKIQQGQFGLTLTDPTGTITDVCQATLSTFQPAYTCQITDGALNASPNVTSETVPATWCEPEQTIPQVGATSYSLDLGYLQDPDVVDGLSRFLFEHDAEEAWFFMGMDGDDPPKAVGKIRLVAGDLPGPGRTTLTATVSLPVDGKPAVCFGNSTTSAPVGSLDPLNVSAAHPAPAAMADLATLQADGTIGDGVYSGPVFTTGQYIVLGDASQAHYASAAWAAGATP